MCIKKNNIAYVYFHSLSHNTRLGMCSYKHRMHGLRKSHRLHKGCLPNRDLKYKD